MARELPEEQQSRVRGEDRGVRSAALDEMAATGFDGIDQVQIHVRTDLTKPDPFCPSSAFIRRAIELMHKHGVSVNGVTWTEGENADIHRKLWDLGFDHFTSDYPVFFSEFTKTIRKD